ncbi:MAG: hypothetical protein Q3966_05135 [Neisseria sp.]|nr:hypothetical protein [Neisseria sp.]
MSQPLEKLETNVSKLVRKFDELLAESRRIQIENVRIKAEQKRKDEQHQATVDELGDTLVTQINKVKKDLKGEIERLTQQNRQYRELLAESAAQIRHLLDRMPHNLPAPPISADKEQA